MPRKVGIFGGEGVGYLFGINRVHALQCWTCERVVWVFLGGAEMVCIASPFKTIVRERCVMIGKRSVRLFRG